MLAEPCCAALRAPADFPVGGKTIRQALIEDYALGLAPDMLFELMGYLAGGERRRKAKAAGQRARIPTAMPPPSTCWRALETFGPIHPDPEAFLECLEPLQPRLYSISSSPLATPGEMHLTVERVRYDIDGRTRLGVASTFLADRLRPATRVKVYMQKAHGFALPDDRRHADHHGRPRHRHRAVPLVPVAAPGDQGERRKPGCSSATSARRPTSSIATSSTACWPTAR